MDDLKHDHAKKRLIIHRLGDETQLADKTTYLPNPQRPFVVRKMTIDQIAAIPKEKYTIAVGKAVDSLTTRPTIQVYTPKTLADHRRQRFQLRKGDNTIAFIRLDSPQDILNENKSTKFYTTLLILKDLIKENGDDFYSYIRGLEKDNDNGWPPDSNLFYPPVDEDRMSDCIMKIFIELFRDKDKCKIYGKEYKVADFCALTHSYFTYIKIIPERSRKPFYVYLEKKVFRKENDFTRESFSNKAKDIDEATKKLNFNFNFHPQPSGTIKDAFHEIGWFFHNSSYFEELREFKRNLINSKI